MSIHFLPLFLYSWLSILKKSMLSYEPSEQRQPRMVFVFQMQKEQEQSGLYADPEPRI